MRVRRLVASVAVVGLLAGCSGEPAGETGDAGDAAAGRVAVLDSAVGCLEIGISLEVVATACGEVTDTILHLEGSPQEAAWVDVGGSRALAELVDGAVWRIRVEDPALRTADSIAVGTPLSMLADHPGIRIVHGEGTYARTEAHCGMSFKVEGLPFRSGGWTGEQLAVLPDSVRVSRILVFGRCD